MIAATILELTMLATFLASTDFRTRIVGGALWCGYFWYSATFQALKNLAEWLYDRNNPPGGPA